MRILQKEHKYLYDGLHPNALGQQLMGEVVIKHLMIYMKINSK